MVEKLYSGNLLMHEPLIESESLIHIPWIHPVLAGTSRKDRLVKLWKHSWPVPLSQMAKQLPFLESSKTIPALVNRAGPLKSYKPGEEDLSPQTLPRHGSDWTRSVESLFLHPDLCPQNTDHFTRRRE